MEIHAFQHIVKRGASALMVLVAACGGDPATGDAAATDGPRTDAMHGSDVATPNDARIGSDAAELDVPVARDAGDVPVPDAFVADVATDARVPTGCAAPRPRPTLTVEQSIGVNALFNDPAAPYDAFGAVREYHDWQWDEGNGDSHYAGYPHNANRFDPSYPSPDWHFDAYYRTLHAHSPAIMASPAIQGSAPGWLTAHGQQIPVPNGADRTLPASYVAHGDHLFQYAARYGSTHVADALLKLDTGQPRLSGAGLLGYFEDGNEPDSFWISDPTVTFTPAGFAAMASADYDGDCSALGTTIGARNADPTARLVMAGLSSDSHNEIDITFLDGIKTWADAHRHGSFPADVINVHHYCNRDGAGISPEDDDLRGRLTRLVQWRDTNVPGRETWLSEFGWDTNPHSPQRAPSIGASPSTVVQGAWLVRGYLAALAAGIDRAFMYLLTDPDEGNTTQYASSGVVWHGTGLPAGVHDLDRKPSWYFVATLHTRLAGMRFVREVPSGNAHVTVFAFRGSDGHGAYAVWCPTSSDMHVTGYALPLSGAPTSATRVVLADGAANGNASSLSITSGHVTLDVGEVPSFVMVDALP